LSIAQVGILSRQATCAAEIYLDYNLHFCILICNLESTTQGYLSEFSTVLSEQIE